MLNTEMTLLTLDLFERWEGDLLRKRLYYLAIDRLDRYTLLEI